MRGDPPPRREAWQGAAPTLSARTRGGGGLGTDFEVDGGLIPEVSNALAARDAKQPRAEDNVGIIPIAIQERAAVAQPFTIMERGRGGEQNLESRQDGTANAILTPNGGRGGLGVGAIATPWAVRRLTPRECERLQGFPDDYTLVSMRGRPAADGPRYKALGNSMAVNAMQWIGERISLVEGVLEAERGGDGVWRP